MTYSYARPHTPRTVTTTHASNYEGGREVPGDVYVRNPQPNLNGRKGQWEEVVYTFIVKTAKAWVKE
jgi:hypothetical protein